MKYGFGVDVGGTTVKLAYFNENGDLLEKWEIPTRVEDGGKNILPDIAAAVIKYMKKNGISREDILGVGIGVPGPVDDKGYVNRCVNLGWQKLALKDDLEKMLNMPVQAGNDASVAALGEYWKGGGEGCRNMVLATLGTGVGGGIVVDGKVLHGVHGAGGEIGHFTLEPEETEICNCGRPGCVEQYCSATGVVRIARRTLQRTKEASALRDTEDLTAREIFRIAGAGDKVAQDVLEQYYNYMGRFLSIVCAVVDPEVVVLGGGVSKAGAPLLEGVRRYYDKYAFHAVCPVRLTLATLGNDAGAYGAFCLLLTNK